MKLDPAAFLAAPELIEALEKRSTPLQCAEDSVLFRQGDPPRRLYILTKGEVMLSLNSAEGEPILTTQAASGSILGLPGLIGNEPYSLTAIARRGAELRALERDDFTALMQSDPQLALKVLQVLAAEVRSARSAILQR